MSHALVMVFGFTVAITAALGGLVLSGRPARTADTGAIAGRVVDALTGRPVPGVPVAATGAGVRVEVRSDAVGRFVFAALVPGQYSVDAVHPRAFGAHGLTTPRQGPTFIPLRSGDSIDQIVVALWPGSEVSGHVRDEAGNAVSGATVRLIPDFDESAYREVAADAEGRYHASRLWPGTYRVVVPVVHRGSDRPSPAGGPGGSGDGGELDRRTLLTTFATSAVDPGEADAIDLGLAEHRRGVDIHVRAAPAATLSGTLDADPVRDTYFQFRLIRSWTLDGLLLPDAAFEDADGGAFLVENLPRAAYMLEVERKVAGDDRIAYWPMRVPVDLTNGNVSVHLRFGEDAPLEPTINIDAALDRQVTTVHGKVRGAGENASVTVAIFPVDRDRWVDWGPDAQRLTRQPIGADHAYAIIGLPPGDYLLTAVPDEALSEWPVPYVLDRLAPSATRVTLEPGAVELLDLQTR